MSKTSLSLIAAGVMAVAGVAQAQTFDSPTRAGEASTMTMGQPDAQTSNSPYSDGTVVVNTTVLGAAPSGMGTPPYAYWGPSYGVHSYGYGWGDVVPDGMRHQAAATFNVPARAGEASTMTGGAPNMVTDNHRIIAGAHAPMRSWTPSSPYSAPGSLYYGS